MTPNRRILGAAIGAALLVAACGSSTGTPVQSPTTPPASEATVPSAAASEAPSSDAGAGETPGASQPDISLAPGNAGDLEAMLPDKVGTQALTKTSFDYSSIPWSSLGALGANGSTDLEKLLKDNGKTLADVRFAMGVGTNAGGAMIPTMVYALQIKGLDASKFVSAFDSSMGSATSMTVGGKPVKGSMANGYGTVTYLHDDVAFIAVGSEADLNSLVAALP